MKLQRVSSTDKGTFGVLVIDYLPFCLTMELPWRDNKTGISCIPPGHYTWKKHTSPSKGPVIWIQDVDDRTWVYFHIANWPSDVRGCVGVGYKYGKSPKGEYGVLESAAAMGDLLRKLPDNGELEVINP